MLCRCFLWKSPLVLHVTKPLLSSTVGSVKTSNPSSETFCSNELSPLAYVMDCMENKKFDAVVRFYESSFHPDRMSLIEFARGTGEARDLLLCLMRTFTSLGRMDRVREVFAIGLRDFRSLSRNTLVSSDRGDSVASDTGRSVGCSRSLSLLNTSFFNAYLEVLTQRKNFSTEEVTFILNQMKAAGASPNALTYHYLIELHIRMGVDPIALWSDMRRDPSLQPLPCTVQSLLLYVVPSSPDASFVVDVTREALRHGSSVADKRLLAQLMEQWLRNTNEYPPEYVLWLMLELELRCVLDKASFVQFVQKQHVAELLQRCAKCADAGTAAKVLAMMDRHVMTKTADILSLVVWCLAQALELEKAFDLLELMARKGHLELTDPFKKYTVDCLRHVMDRHFMMALADAVSSAVLLDRVLLHLRRRRERGQTVSVHSLDLLVLSAAKLGEDRRSMTLVSNYITEWGVQPRTNTYNSLLVGLAAQRGASLQRVVYEAMLENGVTPNAFTFRVLIRQAVLADSIDEAMDFLHKVTSHTGLRVEVEMLLPIMERAARAGDADTVNRVSKFALDCDIGIDAAVLSSVMKLLTEAGQDVEVIKGHQPLHEALRSRSKSGRQRVRHDITS
ncbi:pentatricopeptidecontaining protein [Trypanosoma theileri]|uniref:Pentatricopeptidecontaining protein n=1 Tax=Trypanosoma theileri TaxID=67003 RepID=A0A1X0NYY0_9TRYP|nr:pentatricopeptidecontaining protein [Trypanosoma theileri]ORC89360.1 pentatricopeptidecontaining protein [Trypanosoma theileri]